METVSIAIDNAVVVDVHDLLMVVDSTWGGDTPKKRHESIREE